MKIVVRSLHMLAKR